MKFLLYCSLIFSHNFIQLIFAKAYHSLVGSNFQSIKYSSFIGCLHHLG